jgi:SAM-dependent methyltransferase
MNALPERRFREVDDLLAFVSIYEDTERIRRLLQLIRDHRDHIEGKICVEAGAGFGIFSAEMARLGAERVYAVEQNSLLAELAYRRLHDFDNVQVVNLPIQEFEPQVEIDLLFHELYGQLLYDEDLFALEQLPFQPRLVLPDSGVLMMGLVSSSDYVDASVTPEVLDHLDGVLVSGLFEEKLTELEHPVLRWEYGRGLVHLPVDLSEQEGDLLCFGLRIEHQARVVCEAGVCPNWSYVWTPRKGDRFRLSFDRNQDVMECVFEWLE